MRRSSSATDATAPDPAVPTGSGPRRRGIAGSEVVGLLRASHPRQTLLTAAGLTAAAALADRPARELALVFVTVVVGQLIVSWHHELADRQRDQRRERSDKPVASGWVASGNAWYAVIVAALLVVPLSISHGVVPGLCYLASLVTAAVASTGVRTTPLSFVPWAVTWALYPPFLGAGGWGGEARPEALSWTMVGLFAALGVAVHVLRALPGLVEEHEDGWHSLPLVLARRIGATPLLVVAAVTAVTLAVAILLVGLSSGLGGATLG